MPAAITTKGNSALGPVSRCITVLLLGRGGGGEGHSWPFTSGMKGRIFCYCSKERIFFFPTEGTVMSLY